MNMKMPPIVGIFIFISRENFMNILLAVIIVERQIRGVIIK